MLDLVDYHRCNQPGVVNFDAQYGMPEDKPPPFLSNIFVVRKECHAFLENPNRPISLFSREAKSI